jgi:hypothetical protein
MPTVGEKTSEYPFGYGYCQCGCGKTTKLIGDIHLKYFRSFHNPKVRENFLARRRAKQTKLAKQAELARQGQAFEKSRGKELFEAPEMPLINQPATDAVAKEKQNNRLSHAVAWTKVNQDFIKWHRKKLRARTNETTKRYHRERRKRDPIFKLLAYVRGRIRGALSRKNLRKSTKTEQLLGCSVQELKNHLQAQFKAGMSWDNYGDWHVDHIRPCCNFDLTKIEQQKICFHYTNLQPLWAEENFKKSGRYEPQSENAS